MNWLSRLTIICTMAYGMPAAPLFCSSDISPMTNEKIDPSIAWSQGNKHFTTTFYPHAAESSKNIVFSPVSLQLGLAMTAELAVGKTQQEIIETAVLPEEATTRQLGVERILARLNSHSANEGESIQLSLTNGAWLSSKVSFHPSIKQLLSQYYQAELYPANFHLFPEETRQEINGWVEEKTQHYIQNLLPEGSIDQLTQMVVINTLYMRAPWAKPFNPEMTYEAPFYGTDQSFVPYMHEIGIFGLLKETYETIIELPFQRSSSHSVSLFIVLPHSKSALAEVEKNLTTRRLDHWITNTKPTYVDLSLPKFKIASHFNAKELLKKMGLQRPFSLEATFHLGERDDHVMITDIVHQAVFEVDEQGGSGSAATGIVIGIKSCQKIPQVVNVNRPFLVFVADKTSGVVLFAGRVIHPKSE
jgi:serpin B